MRAFITKMTPWIPDQMGNTGNGPTIRGAGVFGDSSAARRRWESEKDIHSAVPYSEGGYSGGFQHYGGRGAELGSRYDNRQPTLVNAAEEMEMELLGGLSVKSKPTSES